MTDRPIEYALTVIHGPAGRGDVYDIGDLIPPDWPLSLVEELRQHGAISTQRPESRSGKVRPPVTVELLAYARRQRAGDAT